MMSYNLYYHISLVRSLLLICYLSAENAELYSKSGVPFVMGTTGGDRDLLYKTVQEANLYAVISPQMGKQVKNVYGIV